MKRTALVTGSNGGFGLAIAQHLLSLGYTVYAGMRNVENGQPLLRYAERETCNERLHVVPLDVTNAADIENVMNEIEQNERALHLLVNNAGYCQGGLASELDKEMWSKQWETNVLGAVMTTRAALPLMKEGAKIVNITSVSGFFGLPGVSAYTSSKFALEGFSESLRLELLPQGIYVSTIAPGPYQTKIWEKGLETPDYDDESKNRYMAELRRRASWMLRSSRDPDEIQSCIEKIDRSRKPRLRYTLGPHARVLKTAKLLLPWSMIEMLVIKLIR